MTGATTATHSGELLRERERRGVRTLTLVRGGLVLLVLIFHWFVGNTLSEKLATTVLASAALVAVWFSLTRLRSNQHVLRVGLLGCLVDISVLTVLPLIWYTSVGGTEVPPGYMLKTQLTPMTLTFVAMNGLALRPLYPLAVAAGGLLVHLALLGYTLSHPSTAIAPDFLQSVMGPAISVEFVLISMMTIAGLGTIIAYITTVARRTITQAIRLEVANAHLGRYFSPGVADRIRRADGSLLSVGGRTQEVAVMFCDIRDFTTITENLAPTEVLAFLSDYHAHMVEVIFGHRGTVDKFIGDAIMVTFGTPDPETDDAERAVRTGLDMNRALAELNAERARRGLVEIRHGIGIHYGPVIAGNIGTEERLEYTVMGDAVNVASRIQDACKTLGESLLVSKAVAQRLPDDLRTAPLSEQRVKGRRAPVHIYTVASA